MILMYVKGQIVIVLNNGLRFKFPGGELSWGEIMVTGQIVTRRNVMADLPNVRYCRIVGPNVTC